MRSKFAGRAVRVMVDDHREGPVWKRRHVIEKHIIKSNLVKCLLREFETVDPKDRATLVDVAEEYFGDTSYTYRSLNSWRAAVRHAFVVAASTGDDALTQRLEDLFMAIDRLKGETKLGNLEGAI